MEVIKNRRHLIYQLKYFMFIEFMLGNRNGVEISSEYYSPLTLKKIVDAFDESGKKIDFLLYDGNTPQVNQLRQEAGISQDKFNEDSASFAEYWNLNKTVTKYSSIMSLSLIGSMIVCKIIANLFQSYIDKNPLSDQITNEFRQSLVNYINVLSKFCMVSAIGAAIAGITCIFYCNYNMYNLEKATHKSFVEGLNSRSQNPIHYMDVD